ncbi:MAG TPA: acyl-CoA dehydrogenase [Pseudonocardiaceae bacterium]|nr:acyl-CoA dehydrogenase [Pseudonocardiaceae bacterium]
MYQAPVGDYEFLFRHVVDGARLVAAATGGEATLDDVVDVLRHAGTFAARVLDPLNATGDRVGARFEDGAVHTPPGFQDAYRAFTEAGWQSLGLPEPAGGAGMPLVVSSATVEFWSAANMALSIAVGLSGGAVAAIAAAGGEQVRRTYLPPLVSGRWTGTMNLTEPQAGTDLASIRTTARPLADGSWSVTGQKIFISWGDHDLTENIVHLVLARTPDAPAGLAGLSLFVVPRHLPGAAGRLGGRNRVHTVSVEHKLGIRASPTCVLDYDGATGFLLGERHQGLAAMFVMMNAARLGVGIQALGVADRAYQRARDYAGQRVQGRVLERPAGTAIAEHPDVRRLLLSMGSALTAMRALATQVSAWLDDTRSHRLAEFFLPVFKGWATETGVAVTSDAIQVHGGVGYVEETGVAQYYRDIRILPIYEGTNGIQAIDLVTRKLAANGGASVWALLDELSAIVKQVEASNDPAFGTTGVKLREALEALTRTSKWLLERVASAPNEALAGATPYLQQFGATLGGCMLASEALGAKSDGITDAARYVSLARFFAENIAVQAGALERTVTESAESVAAADAVLLG